MNRFLLTLWLASLSFSALKAQDTSDSLPTYLFPNIRQGHRVQLIPDKVPAPMVMTIASFPKGMPDQPKARYRLFISTMPLSLQIETIAINKGPEATGEN